jgi:hypothetical protein
MAGLSKESRLPEDFYPYPVPKQALDDDTAAIISKLNQQGKLNRKVIAILRGLDLLPTS